MHASARVMHRGSRYGVQYSTYRVGRVPLLALFLIWLLWVLSSFELKKQDARGPHMQDDFPRLGPSDLLSIAYPTT